ncbi:hypothetical protein DF3PA_70124 [Candidatus Defluviicoccus seviourii]|uniref:Uncharacterized protein n=1 Tax=Candidatus Defluviicoccus seviourii TaxID=2565273 RepID=A0A564WJL6_9PROT|nr:hypothetical protein DF3PA_70124 [Candidatus Defluviicoccus seviourii]
MTNDDFIHVEHTETMPVQALIANFCVPCGPVVDVQVMWPAPFAYFIPAHTFDELKSRAPSLKVLGTDREKPKPTSVKKGRSTRARS